MTDAKTAWEQLASTMMIKNTDIARGKMMSADALTTGGKVFVFYSTKGGGIGLGARVGRDADLVGFGLTEWQHLAPFKTKPPMKDWIVVGVNDLAKWAEVADFAFERALERNK